MIRVVHLTLPSNSTSVVFPPHRWSDWVEGTAEYCSVFLTHRGWDGECEEHLFDSWDLLDRQSFVVGQCWAVRSKALQSNGLVTSGLLSGEFCQYAAAVWGWWWEGVLQVLGVKRLQSWPGSHWLTATHCHSLPHSRGRLGPRIVSRPAGRSGEQGGRLATALRGGRGGGVGYYWHHT